MFFQISRMDSASETSPTGLTKKWQKKVDVSDKVAATTITILSTAILILISLRNGGTRLVITRLVILLMMPLTLLLPLLLM